MDADLESDGSGQGNIENTHRVNDQSELVGQCLAKNKCSSPYLMYVDLNIECMSISVQICFKDNLNAVPETTFITVPSVWPILSISHN